MSGVTPGPRRLYPSLSWLQHPNPGNCHPDGLSEREVPGEGPRGARATRREGRGCGKPQQKSPGVQEPPGGGTPGAPEQGAEVRHPRPERDPEASSTRPPTGLPAPSPPTFPPRFTFPSPSSLPTNFPLSSSPPRDPHCLSPAAQPPQHAPGPPPTAPHGL